MAVKYDKPIIKIIAYGMGLFVAIFMTFTLLDTNTRGTFQHNAAEFNQYKVKKADELNKIPERLTATEGGSLIVTAADSLTAKGSVTPADSTGAKADTTK